MECGDSCCGSGVLEAVHVVENGHHQDLEWTGTPASCRMDTRGDTGKLHHIIAPGPDCTMVLTRILLYLRWMDGILILYKLHIVLLGTSIPLGLFSFWDWTCGHAMLDKSWDTRTSYYIPAKTDPKHIVWLSITCFESELNTCVANIGYWVHTVFACYWLWIYKYW